MRRLGLALLLLLLAASRVSAQTVTVTATDSATGQNVGAVGDFANKALRINCITGCAGGGGGGGTSMADLGTFTLGTTTFTPGGGTYNTTVAALSSGVAAAFQITAYRALHVNLRDAAGAAFGVPGNPLEVKGSELQVIPNGDIPFYTAIADYTTSAKAGVTAGGALKVDPSDVLLSATVVGPVEVIQSAASSLRMSAELSPTTAPSIVLLNPGIDGSIASQTVSLSGAACDIYASGTYAGITLAFTQGATATPVDVLEVTSGALVRTIALVNNSSHLWRINGANWSSSTLTISRTAYTSGAVNFTVGCNPYGSGQIANVTGTVTTVPPANASTNVAQFGGTNVSTGTGAGGAGIPRVTMSNDSSLAANQSVNFNQLAGAAVATNTGAATAGTLRAVLASNQPTLTVTQTAASSTGACTTLSAVTANGAGLTCDVGGYGSAIIEVTCTACAGGTTVNFEVDNADGTFVAHYGTQLGTTTKATATTTSGVTLWSTTTAGLIDFRARVSGYSAGTVTVSVRPYVLPVPTDVVNANVTNWLGSAAPTVGQKVMASSVPVVIASDQSTLAVQGPGSAPVYVAGSNVVAGDQYTLASSSAQTTGNNSLASIKTNTDPLVAAGGGGYVRQDSTATMAKETGGNLATAATNTGTTATNTAPLVAPGAGGYVRQDSTATIAKESGGNLASIVTNTAAGATRDVTDRAARLLGHVSVDAEPSVSTATATFVGAAVLETTLLAANASRKGILVVNQSSKLMLLKFGTGIGTTSYTAAIAPGATFSIGLTGPVVFTGAITGIWFGLDGGGAVITEM